MNFDKCGSSSTETWYAASALPATMAQRSTAQVDNQTDQMEDVGNVLRTMFNCWFPLDNIGQVAAEESQVNLFQCLNWEESPEITPTVEIKLLRPKLDSHLQTKMFDQYI